MVQITQPYYAFITIDEPIDQASANAQTPTTHEEAFNSVHKDHWIHAMDNEFHALEQAATWHLVDATEAKNVITGKWVFKVKFANGKLQKFKARYCARGFSQVHGVDYWEIFSPVARPTTINSSLAIANQRDGFIWLGDISNAFVRTPVKDVDLYVDQPKGYAKLGPNGQRMVYKLDKYLYGLLQSSREFNKHLNKILLDYNFIQSQTDTCLYTKQTQTGSLTLSIYVDDIIMTATNEKDLELFTDYLQTHYPITLTKLDKDKQSQIVGLEIHYDKMHGVLNISQKNSILTALKTFNLEHATNASTPMEYGWHSDLHSATTPDDTNEFNSFPIREALGCLNNIALQTRPDIHFATNKCQQEMHKPTYS
jgi:hypothetical protein